MLQRSEIQGQPFKLCIEKKDLKDAIRKAKVYAYLDLDGSEVGIWRPKQPEAWAERFVIGRVPEEVLQV